MKYILILFLFVLASCGTVPNEPIVYYHQPDEAVEAAVIHGMESPGKFLGKGHEKIFICEVDGEQVLASEMGESIRISPGMHEISVCYKEGANRGYAVLEAELEPSTEYQIQLGEHSWTVVNFWIEYKASKNSYIDLTTVPKISPMIIFY